MHVGKNLQTHSTHQFFYFLRYFPVASVHGSKVYSILTQQRLRRYTVARFIVSGHNKDSSQASINQELDPIPVHFIGQRRKIPNNVHVRVSGEYPTQKSNLRSDIVCTSARLYHHIYVMRCLAWRVFWTYNRLHLMVTLHLQT